ncbi:MAG: hypothetical protein KME26_11255 [Oscillatoria princeps RMCB-10]|jgi:hypothetical protein|nr:hypothetical protein [Oscillatoria princeps RMCB-10]
MSDIKPPLTEPNWQEAIDRRFQDRLMRPLVKPGIIDTSTLARRIISRWQGFANRLPLLSQLEGRWAGVRELSAGQVPIVYAQQLREPANPSGAAVAPAQVSQRVATPTVQAKFAPAAGGAGASEATGTAEPSPLPVAPSQPVQRPPAQSGLLPAVSAEPAAATGTPQVSSSPLPVVASQTPTPTGTPQVSSSPLPVVVSQTPTPTGTPQVSSSPLPVVVSQTPTPTGTPQVSSSPLPVVVSQPPTPTGTAEPSPLPVVVSQPVQGPEAQAGLLPAVYAQPPGGAAAKANSQPARTQASPLPVVPAKFTSGSNLAPQVLDTDRVLPVARVFGESFSPGESPLPPEIRAVRDSRLPAIGQSSTPVPVVRVSTGAQAAQQLSGPLLRNLAAGNATVGSPAITAMPPEIRTPSPLPVVAGRPAAGPTGAGTPLVLSVPPALAGQRREANSSQPLASAPHSPGTGSAAKTAASQQTPARLPPVSGAQAERNIAPETEKPAKIDTDELADKIERKLMRRLTIENERRGRGQWR